MRAFLVLVLGAMGLFGYTAYTEAALQAYVANGANLVYDTDYGANGLTWVSDANLFRTLAQGDAAIVTKIIAAVPSIGGRNIVSADFDPVNGWMNWWGALAWAQWLGQIHYAGASDWRLWSPLNQNGTGPCSDSFTCTDSELGHLFFIEGGLTGGQKITANPPGILPGFFTNLQTAVPCWSNKEYNSDDAYRFGTVDGWQDRNLKTNMGCGWVVRPGRVPDVFAIPTISEWGLVALSVLLLYAGVMRVRRLPA